MSVRLLVGDALEQLRTLESESVQVVCTSPPYFALRSYLNPDDPNKALEIGSESTPSEFVAKLVAVFDEVKRVMRKDATLWVNLGDSYSGSGKGPTGHNGIGDQEQRQGFTGSPEQRGTSKRPKLDRGLGTLGATSLRSFDGIPTKNLLLIPERFAIAMQEAGWYVRSRVAWCKKSAMPESVRDRPTSAWEHIWMFSRGPRYFYDATAVAQPSKSTAPSGNGYGRPECLSRNGPGQDEPWQVSPTSSLRNFWLLGPAPSSLAHFATFPPELPRRCILAGTSERGCCPSCRAPWTRDIRIERNGQSWISPKAAITQTGGKGTERLSPKARDVRLTTGWAPGCRCDAGEPVPCVVLDPFAGAGTTLLVASRLGRSGIGIELNPEYARMAEARIYGDCPMFSDVEVTG